MKKVLVLGLIFNAALSQAICIQKRYPAGYDNEQGGRLKEQDGMLNGIGGIVKDGEDIIDALIRKAHQEANIVTTPSGWSHMATMEFDDAVVFVGKYVANGEEFYSAKTMTDERVGQFRVEEIGSRLLSEPLLQPLVLLALNEKMPRVYLDMTVNVPADGILGAGDYMHGTLTAESQELHEKYVGSGGGHVNQRGWDIGNHPADSGKTATEISLERERQGLPNTTQEITPGSVAQESGIQSEKEGEGGQSNINSSTQANQDKQQKAGDTTTGTSTEGAVASAADATKQSGSSPLTQSGEGSTKSSDKGSTSTSPKGGK